MCEAVDMHRKFTYMRASTNRRLFSGQGFVSLFKQNCIFNINPLYYMQSITDF